MISLTVFDSIYDNKTDKRIDLSDWEKFEELLYKLSATERKGKAYAKLISPATYLPDTTRANANVVNWAGWAAVDVDEYVFEGDLGDVLRERYGKWHWVCYSTASSTVGHPKFRMVFPLTVPVEADSIKNFWYALNTELDSVGDRQTKDLSRMYYVPATYAGAHNFIFTNGGQVIDPPEFIERHPMPQKEATTFFERLPESMQKTIVQHRKDQMENNSVSWTSIHDCPFVNRKLIDEYRAVTETGWYHLSYQIMVSIAGNAVKKKYPITVDEIVRLMKELDAEVTGDRYKNRRYGVEAERAIEYVYRNL